MMKKTTFLIMIAFIFLLSGCKQSQIKQPENEGTAADSQQETATSNTTNSVTEAKVVSPSATGITGTYEGANPNGPCTAFSLEVTTSDTTASDKVEGKGTSPAEAVVTCDLSLSGTVDILGKMEGQATGTYTTVQKGTTFEFYMSGPFTGTLKEEGESDLNIQLEGTGNNCPANIPCTNEPDSIQITLKKA